MELYNNGAILLFLIFLLTFIVFIIIETIYFAILKIYESYLIKKFLKTKNPEVGRKALFSLIQTPSSLNKIRNLIKEGVNINLQDKEGNTALIKAAKNKKENFNEMVNKPTTGMELIDGIESPVQYQTTVLQLLIANGADINIKNKKGNTALIEAALNSNYFTVKLLIKNGADAKTLPNDMDLLLACENSDIDKVKFLIERGANVNFFCKVPDFFSNSNYYHKTAFVQRKMDSFYSISNDKDNHKTYSITPLMMICEAPKNAKNLDIAKILLDNGAKINKKNSKGQNALSLAKEKNNTEMVELLKSYGAK